MPPFDIPGRAPVHYLLGRLVDETGRDSDLERRLGTRELTVQSHALGGDMTVIRPEEFAGAQIPRRLFREIGRLLDEHASDYVFLA